MTLNACGAVALEKSERTGEKEIMEGIQIEEYRVGALKDIALLKTHGYVDTNTSSELQKLLGQTIEQGICQFIIDMAAVQYVSSAGWGVFVGEIRRLQEKGGDLKITQMSSEVFEVFEMLEFHRILSSYDSIEEAIEDFDFCRGLNSAAAPSSYIRPVAGMSVNASTKSALVSDQIDRQHRTPAAAITPSDSKPSRSHSREIDETLLPINEKIKKIVLENPILGAWGLKRMLFSPRFGYTRVGLLKLYNILKSLSLDTKTKRFRYFRSR
ncbi:STAS domain-containing protein [candidate division KSB1 bacterium]|nr:STAS domain-containing protein [candidate division KSB1 bacterium]RQW10219.1 MAG: anti-sigma factor antagonist [candidate division KSB1 bacterium]